MSGLIGGSIGFALSIIIRLELALPGFIPSSSLQYNPNITFHGIFMIPFMIIEIKTMLVNSAIQLNNWIRTRTLIKWLFITILFLICTFLYWEPDILGNSDNQIIANPLSTPNNILPEWYYLLFHSRPRSSPNKTIGVILVLNILIIIIKL